MVRAEAFVRPPPIARIDERRRPARSNAVAFVRLDEGLIATPSTRGRLALVLSGKSHNELLQRNSTSIWRARSSTVREGLRTPCCVSWYVGGRLSASSRADISLPDSTPEAYPSLGRELRKIRTTGDERPERIAHVRIPFCCLVQIGAPFRIAEGQPGQASTISDHGARRSVLGELLP